VQGSTVWSLERGTTYDYQWTLRRVQSLTNIASTMSLQQKCRRVISQYIELRIGQKSGKREKVLCVIYVNFSTVGFCLTSTLSIILESRCIVSECVRFNDKLDT